MSESLVIQTLDARVLTLRMNRPKAKNALTIQMYQQMTQALEDASQNDEVRVVIIAGVPGAFSAGNDLNDFMQNPPEDENSPVMAFLRVLSRFQKPLFAAVQGYAIGIGTTMLLHCDLVYASDDAVFQMPFTKLALVPEAGSSFLFTALVGHRRAAQTLLFSERFSASQALEWGVINEVLPAEDVEARAQARACELARFAPESIRLTKHLLKDAQRDLVEQVMAREGSLFIDRLASPELSEAISAFFEKREPHFE